MDTGQLTDKETRIANKYTTSSSPSLIIRQIKMNSIKKQHFTPNSMRAMLINCWERKTCNYYKGSCQLSYTLENNLACLVKLKLIKACKQTITCLHIFPGQGSAHVHKQIWKSMFTAAFFILTKLWKQPQRPAKELINQSIEK